MIFTEPIGSRGFLPASILKRLALLPRSFSLICAQSGRISPSGARLAYIGEGESLPYIKKTFAAGEFDILSQRIPVWRVGEMIRRIPESGTWLYVEINRLLSPLLGTGGFATFPWIRQKVYLDSADYWRSRRRIENNWGRKVRKYGYRFRLVHDAGPVEHFYRHLYLPYVKARFGDACHARSMKELKRAVRKGFLVQVFCGDRWISGIVCTLGMNGPSVRAAGHLPEEEYPLRLGGLSAAYYHLFNFAENHSLACVDFLRSRPNSKDGVYWHKRQWGAVSEKDSWPHTEIRLYAPGEAPIPEILQNLLVWNGREFRELGRSGLCEPVSSPARFF